MNVQNVARQNIIYCHIILPNNNHVDVIGFGLLLPLENLANYLRDLEKCRAPLSIEQKKDRSNGESHTI